MAPFIANNTNGIDSYKWMLFGDDDTVFYVDNILRMLETLDHTMPYILSDHIWFPTDLESEALMPVTTVLPGHAPMCSLHALSAIAPILHCLSVMVRMMQHATAISCVSILCRGASAAAAPVPLT